MRTLIVPPRGRVSLSKKGPALRSLSLIGARWWLLAVSAVLTLVGGPAAPTAAIGNTTPSTPEWFVPGHRISAGAEALAHSLSSHGAQPLGVGTTSQPINSGTPCAAEPSPTGNVQVNCRAEDDGSPQNTQNETSVVAVGNKVVVGFNDTLVCCQAFNASGYSVSLDGGATFTDMGDLPWSPDVQPLGDPSLAADDEGNIYYATLALDGLTFQSLIALYKMPVGRTSFTMQSIPVNVGDIRSFLADKDALAIGRDDSGRQHFYITWTSYAHSLVQGPVMLSDSTDALHWRTSQISPSNTCAPQSPGAQPIPDVERLFISWEAFDIAACTTNPASTSGTQFVATVDAATAQVRVITPVARVQGAGDMVVACGFAPLEVIETAPGHDSRLFEAPSATIDAKGTLYLVWNDRPLGPGGGYSNATRIYLSYSLAQDEGQHWSTPQVISGPSSTAFMNDRYQPAVVADAQGLHAMRYERVQDPSGGPDLLRTNKVDLSLATGSRRPIAGPEVPLSTQAFPIYQTNPNQDPGPSPCYMGDYNSIASYGSTRFVAWGDNRTIVTTSAGVTENQADVFLARY